MSDEKEVAGTETVSQIEVLPEPEVVEAAPEKRGRPRKTGKTWEEKRAYNTQKKKESRERSKARLSEKHKAVDCKVQITKKEAAEVLEERGIQHLRVIGKLIELAQVAAQVNDLPFNDHFLRHGLAATKSALADKNYQPPVIENDFVTGELLTRCELHALHDFSFWRQPEVTFEQWLADRMRFKMSAFETSKILRKEDFGTKHEEWTKFAPRWNPVGLQPNYTQKQALAWLDSQRSDTEGEKKRFLLVASRNSMKSTWVRILALCLTITYPDARILIVSETNKLSKKAMKEFRGYLEAVWTSPTLFQQYFPEFTIAPDEGQSLVYDNPMARLNLPQNSVESSSMESANTGSRFDFCIFDDPISRDNGTGNEDQRAAAIAKHGSIMKLREPAGYAINIQTPWECEDLGDVMIKRNEEDPEHPLAVRIDPVLEVRLEARFKKLLDLTEDDVVLNFLPKLNWRFVRDEMRSPEGIKFFRTQYMCEWVPDTDLLKVQFDPDELRRRTKGAGFFGTVPVAQVVMGLDRAFSTSRYADFSCLAVGKVQPVEGKNALVIADSKMERWRESDLVKNAVSMIERHHPSVFVAEQDRGWENLAESIRRECLMRGVPVPYFRWKVIQPTDKLKAKRAKQLELPLNDGRLWFVLSTWTEAALLQLEKFDGQTRSNNTRKDDFVDVLALLWQEFGPRYQDEVNPEDVKQHEQELEDEAEREKRRQWYQRMFGGEHVVLPPVSSEPEPPPKPNGIRGAFQDRLKIYGSRGLWKGA